MWCCHLANGNKKDNFYMTETTVHWNVKQWMSLLYDMIENYGQNHKPKTR